MLVTMLPGVDGVSRSRPRSSGVRNEIVAKRMTKKQQMRWNRTTVQSFLEFALRC